MNLEDCLEEGDRNNLRGKLLVYGEHFGRKYAIYSTDKPESYATEMSNLVGDSASFPSLINDAESLCRRLYDENRHMYLDEGIVITSPMLELDDPLSIFEVDADRIDAGKFMIKKKMKDTFTDMAINYFDEYDDQRYRKLPDGEAFEGAEKSLFVHGYLNPYICAVQMGSASEVMKERERLRSYSKKEDVLPAFKNDIERIISVMENNMLSNNSKTEWLNIHISLMYSYAGEDYGASRELLQERQRIETALNIRS